MAETQINFVVGGVVNAADSPDGVRLVRMLVAYFDHEPEDGDTPIQVSFVLEEDTAVALGTLLIQHTRGFTLEDAAINEETAAPAPEEAP